VYERTWITLKQGRLFRTVNSAREGFYAGENGNRILALAFILIAIYSDDGGKKHGRLATFPLKDKGEAAIEELAMVHVYYIRAGTYQPTGKSPRWRYTANSKDWCGKTGKMPKSRMFFFT